MLKQTLLAICLLSLWALTLIACVPTPSPEAPPTVPAAALPTTLPTATTVTSATPQLSSTVSVTPTLTEQPPTVTIPFTTIAQEAPLGDHPAEPLYTVVSRPEAWDKLRNVLPARAINASIQSSELLEDSLIVVAFAGMKGSSGYSITIENISQQGDQIAVIVSQKTPSDDDIVTDAKTLPYHLVAFPREKLFEPTLTFVFYDSQGTVLDRKDVTPQ